MDHNWQSDAGHLIDDLRHLGDSSHGNNWQSDLSHLVDDLSQLGNSNLSQVLNQVIPAHNTPQGTGVRAEHLLHFDPTTQHEHIIGHPASEMMQWHQQHSHDTCAIAVQEFLLNSLTGYQFSEETLREEAYQYGWYIPGGGTPLDHTGDLLALYGMAVEHHYGTTLEQLMTQVQEGHGVIVCLNGEDIWSQGQTDNSPLNAYPGVPGQQADHAVEVIGIDNSNPDAPMIILNAPGYSDGRGLEVPVSTFMEAWSSSDNYMVSTVGTSDNYMAPTSNTSYVTYSTPTVGGYYNADGTYQTTIPIRDPETGAIIR